jgi:CubicO group peptidase (beta-lactamase class C family)
LSHRAGIPSTISVSASDYSRKKIAAALESLTPIWRPGALAGYHAVNASLVMDESSYRLDINGRNTIDVLKEEVFSRMGVDDCYIGLPQDQYYRMAHMRVSPIIRLENTRRAFFSDWLNAGENIAIPISWVGGVTNSSTLANLMNIYAYEETYKGVTYFPKEIFDQIVSPTNEADEGDLYLGPSVRWGIGVILTGLSWKSGADHPRLIGHGGGNASYGWADPDERLAIGFVTNMMADPDINQERQHLILTAIYDCVIKRN